MRNEERKSLQALIGAGKGKNIPELHEEKVNDSVRHVQTLLHDLGYGSAPTGLYDSATRKAVKKFARDHGNLANGHRVTRKLAELILENHAKRQKPKGKKKDKGDPEPPGRVRMARTVGTSQTVTKTPAADSEPRDYYVNTGVTARLLDVTPVGQQLENWCWAASTEMMLGYLRSLGGSECPACGHARRYEEDISQGRQMNRRLEDPAVDCSVERTSDFDYKACDRGGWPYFFEFQNRVESTKWAARRHLLEEHGLVLRDGGPRLRVRRPLTDGELRGLTYGSGPEFKRRLDNAEGCALSWETLTALLDARRPVAFAYRFKRPQTGHMRLAVGYAVTPGGQKWVAVCDPLPPGTGEVHLIPYEYYVIGPAGGHWRDYWVAPAADDTATAKPALRSSELRVGRGLVASYMTDAKAPQPATGDYRLLEDDAALAARAARAGRDAVEAIAIAAEPLAIRLGMGGNFLQVYGRALVSHLSDQKGIDPEDPQTAPDIRDVSPDELELNDHEPIPVYELWRKDLKGWDQKTIGSLLRRPREIIYELTRPNLRPFSFFAAVTVRREQDEWKLASIGRAHLMATLAQRQLEDWFVQRFLESGAPVSMERLVDTLWKLGLLNPLLRSMSEKELRAIGEAKLGYTKKEIDAYLEQGGLREVQDMERLRAKAREVDKQLEITPEEPLEIEKPKYFIHVPSLYQLLVAYPRSKDIQGARAPQLGDKVEPVYPHSFHRPEKSIKPGTLEEVLKDLQDVAKGIAVVR